jgi:hypothetical protein
MLVYFQLFVLRNHAALVLECERTKKEKKNYVEFEDIKLK